MVSMITPQIMMSDVPPNETSALNLPLKKIGMIATMISPIAPIRTM